MIQARTLGGEGGGEGGKGIFVKEKLRGVREGGVGGGRRTNCFLTEH